MTMPQNFDKTNSVRPARRTDRLAVQPIADETMLYDEDIHKAYLLNPVAAAVWNACDGVSTPAQIAAAATLQLQHPVTEELVHFTLSELRRDNLLQPDEALTRLPLIERRDMLLRLGTAAALLIPVIAMVAPSTAAAQYGGVSQ
jgi:hypothetical protein